MMPKPVALGLLAAGVHNRRCAAAPTWRSGRMHIEPVRQHRLSPRRRLRQAAAGVAETEAVVTPEPPSSRCEPRRRPARRARQRRRRARRASPTRRRERATPPTSPPANSKPASVASRARCRAPRPRPADAPADPASAVERPSSAREPAASRTPPRRRRRSPSRCPGARRRAGRSRSSSKSWSRHRPSLDCAWTTSITSETARVEDRVEARVTRDVMADGRVAIPAGTRVIGDVMLVERGGKMKDKARLGVRFHTLVLANGSQVPFRTDAIYREGSSPGDESARKIGGAAIGGAILGAIIGGAKGAAIGGATGAAGGSAVVMAGDRNAATLPAGTVVTVRLASPVRSTSSASCSSRRSLRIHASASAAASFTVIATAQLDRLGLVEASRRAAYRFARAVLISTPLSSEGTPLAPRSPTGSHR